MLSMHYIASPEVGLVNIYPRFWDLATLFEDPNVIYWLI
jgi:hypothetical protein